MTASEFYTAQFYTWDFRGRGWLLYEQPVHLEPPFIPFFRHGYAQEQIDDGKRPTLFQQLFSGFKEPKPPIRIDQSLLDYETVEPYLYEREDELLGLQIKRPKERKITPDKMKALLVMLSYTDAILSFEIIGTGTEILVQFVCAASLCDTVTSYLSAYFPSCAVIQSNAWVESIIQPESAIYTVDFGLKEEFVRPVHIAKGFSLDPLMGVLTVLEGLHAGEQAAVQILFQPAQNRWSESMLRSVSFFDGTSFFRDAPEAPQLAHEKLQSPLYGVTIRTISQAPTLEDAGQIQRRLNHALITASRSNNNELIPLVHEVYDLDQRLEDIYLRQSHRLGMLLSADELITLMHLPSESIVSKKLYASSRKTKEVPLIAQHKQYILGANTHNGSTSAVTFGIEERLKHTHIIGATGTGKSTLLANLMLQDIAEGNGIILFDPHGDLVDDVLARIPEERMKDVVLIDPSDTGYPVGINLLQAATETEREVISSDLVASFRKHATSWGDQMNSVLGNAILAILESKDGGTLHDLRRFLIEKEFRNTIVSTVSDPSVRYYWLKEYPLLKTNSIGPIITRLDTFLRPRSIRNMVIQKTGLDFETLCNEGKIILCKLSQGLIGAENSYLLGSLLLSRIHQAVLRRQQQTIRKPVFIYLDEFQNFITPSIKEMISGIRKYQVGLTLSHQDLQQLQREDGELLNTVLGNINTRIVFRVGEPDAKRLQEGFSYFESSDLQNLGRGEAVVRIEQPQYDCSLDTIPLEPVEQEEKEHTINNARTYSREKYAKPKADVEAAFYATLDVDELMEKQPSPKKEPKISHAAHTTVPQPPTEQTQSPPSAKNEETNTSPQPSAKRKREQQTKEAESPKHDTHTHRYLQNLVKQMAESRGYKATLEKQLTDNSGSIDVLLEKDKTAIAVEICITTDADWEVHNLEKCLSAGHGMVVSLCTDTKQLDRIRKKCQEKIAKKLFAKIHFYTPDTFFTYLDQQPVEQPNPTETVMKGYRVNVSYDSISPEEMEQKRKSVAKVVMESLRKRKVK